jgi:predicted permease
MPVRFMWRGADVYLPDVFHRGQTVEGERTVHLLGRLKPGVTREQASIGLKPVLEDLERAHPDDFPKQWRIRLETFGETFPSGIQDALWILFGAVGLLLLIACVNVSNLLLSRGAYRRREIAIRAAMGAGSFRIVRQLLSESLLLALGGGAAGVLLAYAGLRGIIAVVPPNTIPDEAQITLNGPVLLFTLAVSVVVSLLFGVTPAFQLVGRDLLTPLREASRGVSGGARQRLMRSALVVAEVALSVVLLVGASLMIRTLLSIQGANLAFHPDRILTLRIPFSEQRYPDAKRRNDFLQDVLRRIRLLRESARCRHNAGMSSGTTGFQKQRGQHAAGDPARSGKLTRGLPRVMGPSLVQGRFPERGGFAAGTHNIAVNQTLARALLGGEAKGDLLPASRTALNLADDSFQIVGVVKDAVNRVSTNETWPELYLPYTLLGRADRIFALGPGRPETLAAALKAQVYAVDPGQPLMEVKSMETVLAENAYARPRFNLLLFNTDVSVFATRRPFR